MGQRLAGGAWRQTAIPVARLFGNGKGGGQADADYSSLRLASPRSRFRTQLRRSTSPPPPHSRADALPFARRLRTGRNGPEARSAVLAGTRVDIFRSKDFLAKLREKPPPNLDALVPLDESSRESEKKIDLQIQRLGVRSAR